MNIILIGPPGSGKGTHADILVKRGYTHISPGVLFRENISQGTTLGKQVEEAVKAGDLIPDMLTGAVVLNKIGEQRDKLLFDGYPRTMGQVLDLEAQRMNGIKIDAVLFFDAPIDVLKARMLRRGRPDDKEEVIENRFQVYEAETAPVVEYYRHHPAFHTIDATKEVTDVAHAIADILDEVHEESVE